MSDEIEENKEKTAEKIFQYEHKRVKTPTVLQMEAVECGAASLAMILGYFGKFIPLEKLRIECGVSRDGTKASNMLTAARKFGLDCKGYKKELDELSSVKFPAIIFWNFNHFVVLEGFKKNKAYLNDPASGKRVLTFDEFDMSYTGVILEFERGESFKPEGHKPSMIPVLRRRIEGAHNVLSYVVLTGLFLLIPGFIVPTFSRFFVDSILVNKMTGFLKPLLVAMGLTALARCVLTWLQQKYLLRFETKLSLLSSAKFLNHIFKLPVEFFAQRMPGEICNRIASNDTIANLLSEKLASAAVNICSVIFYLILMFRYSVVLTLLCIGLAGVNFLLLKLVSEKRKTGMFKIQLEMGKLYGSSMSGISMIETLKASGTEHDFFQQWSGQQSKVVLQNQRMAILSQITTILPELLTKILNLLVLAVGALQIMNGKMTMGMLVAFQALQGSFVGPISEFMNLGSQLQSGQADMQRLDDVMEYPAEKRYKEDFCTASESGKELEYKPVNKLHGYISLKDVEFGYSSLAAPLISELNLELKPGTRIALVGGSGSGKSTIGKLVSSLYKPWKGEVLFDGKPVSEIERNTFTSSVAVVDQDIFLFEGTIKDNLTMWDTTIPEETYMQAAKDACIHDVIASRPGGYFGKIEEGGKNFSGGQRQRLEIARALAANPRILIMDEATSALDPVTEQIVDENIRRRGCTCIIIAHRLSTIRDSDEILVLEYGKIVQRGTHDQLISEDGLYKDLIKTM